MSIRQDELDLDAFARTGARDALGRVAERYLDFVYGLARREVGNAHLAEDVTQAVFVIFCRKASGIRAAALPGWLFTTTRHVAANAKTVAARRVWHERQAAVIRREDSVSDEPATSADLHPHLTAALAAQRVSDRSLVLLRFVRGLTAAEIGAAIGTSEATARKRLQRALDRLREYFERRGITAESAALGAALGGVALPAPPALAVAVGSIASAGAAGIAGTSAVAALANAAAQSLSLASLKATAATFAVSLGLVGVLAAGTFALLRPPPPAKPSAPRVAVALAPPPASQPSPTPRAATMPIPAIPEGHIVYAGTVKDPGAAPVARARVWSELQSIDPSRTNAAEAETVTDESGHYALPAVRRLPDGANSREFGYLSRKLRVEAPPYALAWRDLRETNWPWEESSQVNDVFLQRPATLRVQVIDTNGAPVSGAAVLVSAEYTGEFGDAESYYGRLTLPSAGTKRVLTGPDGIAEIHRVPERARAHVIITHPEYSTYSTTAEYSGGAAPLRPGLPNSFVARLSPGGKIRVRLPDGRVAPNAARIFAYAARPGNVSGYPFSMEPARFESDGSCLISGLAPDTYDVALEVYGEPPPRKLLWQPARGVVVTAGQVSEATLGIASSQPVRGRVVDAETKLPVAGHSVWMQRRGGADGSPAFDAGDARTDEQGKFVLRMYSGNATLRTSSHAPHGQTLVEKPINVPEDRELDVGDIEVQVPPSVRGRLVDEAGNAVVGKAIGMSGWADTDANGYFVLRRRHDLLGRAEPLFAYSNDRSLGKSLLVTNDLTDPALASDSSRKRWPSIVLKPVASVSGRVVDEQGRPLDAVRIWAMVGQGHLLSSPPNVTRRWMIERGGSEFAMRYLPVGLPFKVALEKLDAQESISLEDLAPGETRYLGDLVLAPKDSGAGVLAEGDFSGSVFGQVVDEAGAPVAGVRIQPTIRKPGWHPNSHPETDHEGRFELNEAPKGEELILIATRFGYQERSARVTVEQYSKVSIELRRIGAGVIGDAAPEIDAAHWFNSEPITLENLRGRIVLLHVGVHVRGETMRDAGTAIELSKKYREKGLDVILVHRALREHDPVNPTTPEDVEKCLKENQITLPVAIDTRRTTIVEDNYGPEGETMTRYALGDNSSFILIDRKGIVRGVFDQSAIEREVQKLLAE